MPFGLRNTAQSFQRFIDQVLRGLTFCYAYIDDLLIASASPEEHKTHLRQVLQRLSDQGMVMNPAKCVLGVPELDFLGHRVSAQGIQPLEGKVSVIRDFPQPVSLRKLREFLGLINFYHRLIPNCANILEPLNRLLSSPENNPRHLPWDEESNTVFNAIKQALADATLLVHPKPHAPTSIMADASDCAVGADGVPSRTSPGSCAQQKQDTAPLTENCWPSTWLLSTFVTSSKAVSLFVLTDHKPLTFALATHSDKYTPGQTRHLDFVSQFTADIRHVSGAVNPVANALSRAPVNALQVTQPPAIDFEAMAKAQSTDSELRALQSSSSSSLQFSTVPHLGSPTTLVCVSTGNPRPFVPVDFRRAVFNSFHSLSHPGIKATQHLVTEWFVWPGMNDIRTWTKSCLHCQRAKIDCHTPYCHPSVDFHYAGRPFPSGPY